MPLLGWRAQKTTQRWQEAVVEFPAAMGAEGPHALQSAIAVGTFHSGFSLRRSGSGR